MLPVWFALCSFFEPYLARLEWQFGGLSELWSQNIMKQSPLASPELQSVYNASCLVPINSIAGKFIPGKFTLKEAEDLGVLYDDK